MTENKSEKLGTMPIDKLLLNMSLPAVFSMLIQALYNIVDSIYVAKLGQDALFSIGLVFPMQMLSLAIGLGCGVGTNAMVARRLGQKRLEHANQTATTGLILSIFHSLLILGGGLLFAKPFLSLFTQDAQIIEMGASYLMIVMGLGMGQQIQIICERILQATGNMILPMFSLLISAGINIVLDPIMIFGYFGFPALGVAGAALATVIGQWIGMLFILYVLIKQNHDIKISLKGFKLEKVVIQKIYQIGIPTMIMNAIGSVTTTCMNGILVGFSDVAVNALSIYFKLQSFVFMPILGMNQGAMPILSYNYGAQDKKRYTDTLKLMLKVAIAIMLAGTLIFNFFPNLILSLFNPTEQLLEIGTVALRIISFHFIFAAVGLVITVLFQSLGYGIVSMLMSLFRQLVFLVPLAYLFAKFSGLNQVWWSYAYAEAIVMFIFTPFALKAIHKKFKN